MDTALSTLIPILVTLAGGLCSLLGVLAVVGVGFFVLRRSGALSTTARSGMGGIDVDALGRMYTERLGYQAVVTSDPGQTHMVRTVGGVEVHLRSHTAAGGSGTSVEYGWSTPAGSALQVHVVEQTVADGGKRFARDAARNRTRRFQPRWPIAFPTGHALLDGRFRVFAPSARHATEAVVLAAPLLACAHVELAVDATGATLSDPFQDGLLSRMGGPMGMARVATPAGIEVQAQLHDEAAALLVAAVAVQS